MSHDIWSDKMKIVLLTRTGRPSGAMVAAELLKGGHNTLAIVAEKRSSMLTKKEGLSAVVFKALKRQGAGFVASKVIEAAVIELNYIMRRMKIKRVMKNYMSVRELLLDHCVPYFQVDDHNSETTAEIIRGLCPDVIVLSNTRIIKPNIITLPKKGCLNLHMGKLPEYRGTASCFWELFNGEKRGGVTVHFVDEKLDSGDIALEEYLEISSGDTEKSLYKKKLRLGAEMVKRAVDLIETGSYERKKQDISKARMYHWPTKEERAELKNGRAIR